MYSDSTAVLGPLATYAEPHCYDLCAEHAERLTAPRGWDVLRLAPDLPPAGPCDDDLLALADAVREAARPRPEPARTETAAVEIGRRGHLRVLRDPRPDPRSTARRPPPVSAPAASATSRRSRYSSRRPAAADIIRDA